MRTTASASSRPRSVSTRRSALRVTSPSANAPFGARPARRRLSAPSGSPRRSRSRSITSSVWRVGAVELLEALRPAAALRRVGRAYALGCLTFHQRCASTWPCAPGPAPHHSPAVPVAEVVPALPAGDGSSWTPRTSRTRLRAAGRRAVRSGRRARRRRGRRTRRGARGGPAQCRPRRPARTPRRDRRPAPTTASTERRRSSSVSPGVP